MVHLQIKLRVVPVFSDTIPQVDLPILDDVTVRGPLDRLPPGPRECAYWPVQTI
jgi:hypothetical protein